jgi:DNA-binding transcriptional MerR regulator
MLTIGRLAAYAGVTVRAVRHCHRIGLMPEPARDRSGYRIYDAAAITRLIRIHALADAGVPLARVQELLDAGPVEFAAGVEQIDREMRAEIRRLQGARRRLGRLADGEQLALPAGVVGYLDRLRGMGVSEQYIAIERDAWVMVAAQVPEQIEAVMAKKHEYLDDPDMVRLYHLISGAFDCPPDDPRVVEVADILERLRFRAMAAGELGAGFVDDQFAALLDAAMLQSSPAAGRLIAILEERGWKGWTRIERVPTGRLEPAPGGDRRTP